MDKEKHVCPVGVLSLISDKAIIRPSGHPHPGACDKHG